MLRVSGGCRRPRSRPAAIAWAPLRTTTLRIARTRPLPMAAEPENQNTLTIRRAGALAADSCARSRRGLHGADARPGTGHPARARRARRPGRAQTGTGKTAAFALPDPRPAAAPHANTSLLARPPPGPLPRPDPDARAGRPGRRRPSRPTVDTCRSARRSSTAACRSTPDQGAARRGRDPRRHAGPPARPRRPARREPRPGRDPRPRRGRPDAGHGLHARHPAHPRPAPRAASRRCCSRPRSRDDIKRLGGIDPQRPRARSTSPATAPPPRRSSQLVYLVDRERKEELLAHLVHERDLHQVLVFTRTKLAASRLASWLDRHGVEATAIHCDRAQPDRDEGPRGVQERRDPGPRGHRRGGARPGHRRPAPRRQLRAAVEPRGLRPPDRRARAARARPATRSASCRIDEADLLRSVQRLLQRAIAWEVEPGFEPRQRERRHCADRVAEWPVVGQPRPHVRGQLATPHERRRALPRSSP